MSTKTSRNVRELDRAPNLLPLLGKAALNMALPGRGGDGGGGDLPDLELVLGGVTTDPDDLAAYDRVCGFRYDDRLPPTYPHIQTFPLQVELMTDDSFPFALAGLVHVGNTITQHRWIAASEAVTYHVHAEDLRPHPKGQQFDMVATGRVDGEVVWESTSTYLHRGGGGGDGEAPDAGADAPNLPDPTFSAEWRVPGDTGRRYAAVSGDRNPIHLHPLTARLFGYPKPIAHGMWTKARALAGLEGRLPDAFTVDVVFKKPLLLPATVHFKSEQADGTWRFAVTPKDGGTAHLEGTLTAD
ncbi:MAG: MaoC/PaaZ C-terminal domain-containing protein [Nitriliruptorales bacterium]|nr:MaoC/PaaZ C-terminal domain-containing protein [Nitriliruptorales bacterium]